MAGKARVGREYFCKYFLLSLPYATAWPLLGILTASLFCFAGDWVSSTACPLPALWSGTFCSQTKGPWRLLWCPDGVMWHLWAQCPGERSEDSPWSVGEMWRKRESRLPCHLMRMMNLGVQIGSGLRPSSDRLRLWTHPWGSLEGPWEPLNQTFSKVEPPTKGAWQPSFQFRIIYVSCVWE